MRVSREDLECDVNQLSLTITLFFAGKNASEREIYHWQDISFQREIVSYCLFLSSSNWDDKYERIYIDMRHREFLTKDCILPKVSPDRLIERNGTPEPACTARQVLIH